MNLVPLFEEALEFQDYNGTVLSNGKVAVYYIGRTRLANIYEDVEGSVPAENPRILNNLGMGPVYVNPAFDYEMVVFDTYGSELFSVKKYLASKGEHSTANVVVTPSESIAVSAWTVGDVQVYMPYLTGQLGKVYEGIDPIVVNNQVDKISANHVPLGVQDPLYFVQDDEEGCIIGCSAQTEIPSALSGKWDEASDVVIANSAQWAEGTEYEAGSYVDIDGNTINVTGLQPAGNYQSAGDYVSASELENLQPKGDYYSASNPSGFITGVDLTDYAKTEDLTAYQPVGDYYSASNPSGFINSDAISAMATTGFVADVSGDITALIPSIDGLMSADLLEISDNKITGYNGTAFAGQGGVTGDYELVAGSGVELVDDPDAHTTTINVTAQGGNPEVEQAVIDNSATWNEVSAKADNNALNNYLPLSGGSISSKYSTISNAVTNIGQYLMSGNQQVAQYSLDRIENDNFSANSTGIYSPYLTADNIKFLYSADDPGIYTVNSGFDNNTYALCQSSNSWQFGIGGPSAAFYAKGVLGLTDISTQNRYLGQNLPSITVSSNYGALKLNSTGGEFILNPTSNNSAVKWRIGESTYLWNGQGDTNYNMPILLAAMPKSQQWSYAPFISANYDHIELTKGISGPRAIVDAQYYSGGYSAGNLYYYVGINGISCSGNSMDVQVYVPNQTATYSLRNSIQIRDIDGDSATSAITAIAGSAIGGGVPQSAFDEATAKIAELENILSSYSGQWLLA